MNIYASAALRYLDMGLSVVPIDYQKMAKGGWQQYQYRQMTPMEAQDRFCRRDVLGIAVIAGQISGGFEGLDFDAKYDLSGNLFEGFWSKLALNDPKLADRLVKASTKNKGRHVYYRYASVGRHLELARRHATPEELKVNAGKKTRTLIETRSNGQYIIVPPSHGYQFIQNDLSTIPVIQRVEWKTLLDLARTFNQYFDVPKTFERVKRISGHRDKPLDDFDERGDVVGLLKKHGWVVVDEKSSKTVFRRPGDTKQWSSGDYDHNIRRFTVFTRRTVFTAEWGYRPSAVFAFLECHGDFKLAAKVLLEQGYGVPYRFSP